MQPGDFVIQRPFRELIDAYNRDKVFGVTHFGVVGMFPRSAQPGDQIYLLFGGDWPFLLRKMDRPKEFQLVGQCYVHSIMQPGHLKLDKLVELAEGVHLCGPFESENEQTI